MKVNNRQKTIISLAIILGSLALSYIPLPGLKQNIIIVSGTELQEPLKILEQKFEQTNPSIEIELKFQGSQDIVNNYIAQKNDFTPTVLIPANGEILQELETSLNAQGNNQVFFENPRPIAKTILVGIAWPERGQALFPQGEFQWQKLSQAMRANNWQALGGKKEWGSFDLMISDPNRSNSGQLSLILWTQSLLNKNNLSIRDFSDSSLVELFALIKRSVYLPPRSTDILLQEFISRGANNADVATVYESIALFRWSQATANQNQSYQIYYLNPTIETVSTAAIILQGVSNQQAQAGSKFIDFLTEPEQQQVFIQYGFRPVISNLDVNSIPNSPWQQNIPGVEVNPPYQILPPPSPEIIGEIQRLWQRAEDNLK